MQAIDKEAVMAKICKRLTAGQFMAEICKDPAMPDQSTVNRWMASAGPNSEIAQQYAHARELQFDALAMEALTVAKRPKKDMVAVQADRLHVDTVLRLLSKWAPSKYGDRVEVKATHEHRLSPLEELRGLELARRPTREALPSGPPPAIQHVSGVAVDAAIGTIVKHREREDAAMDFLETPEECF